MALTSTFLDMIFLLYLDVGTRASDRVWKEKSEDVLETGRW